MALIVAKDWLIILSLTRFFGKKHFDHVDSSHAKMVLFYHWDGVIMSASLVSPIDFKLFRSIQPEELNLELIGKLLMELLALFGTAHLTKADSTWLRISLPTKVAINSSAKSIAVPGPLEVIIEPSLITGAAMN